MVANIHRGSTGGERPHRSARKSPHAKRLIKKSMHKIDQALDDLAAADDLIENQVPGVQSAGRKSPAPIIPNPPALFVVEINRGPQGPVMFLDGNGPYPLTEQQFQLVHFLGVASLAEDGILRGRTKKAVMKALGVKNERGLSTVVWRFRERLEEEGYARGLLSTAAKAKLQLRARNFRSR